MRRNSLGSACRTWRRERAVRQLCGQYPDGYCRKVDEERACPEA